MQKKLSLVLMVVVISTATLFSQHQSKPKNIILLIGDGFGLSQVSASVLSLKNDPFKKFHSIGLVNTCSADNLITDSAAGATAYATGYRTKNGRISVDENGNPLETITEIAQKKKMSIGIVVTSSLTNATPAAFLSHSLKRQDEFNIAEQIVKSKVDILFGAGTDFFLSKEFGGKREDSKNLIDSMIASGYNFIKDPSEVSSASITKKSIGLFSKYSLPHADKRNYSLGLLTKLAIDYLSKDKDGFFLMIEGSQIDWAADHNDSDYLFAEILDFNSAIEEALRFAEKDKNTLVIVTSDHDTGSAGITGINKESNQLVLSWATKSHTANFVGIFSFGPSSKLFEGFLDNYTIGRKLINLIDPKKKWK